MPLGLILAGASALGSLLSGKSKQRAARRENAEYEARLRAATGYDFTKLRDQAISAGFNPLTVLQATGGAGYDGRGAVSPGNSAQYAGAFGDAIGVGANVFGQFMMQDRQLRIDEERNNIARMSLPASSFGSPVLRTNAAVGPAAQTPFFAGGGGSLWKNLGLPEDWWNPAPFIAPAVQSAYSTSTV